MTVNFNMSETKTNLMRAFAGESQARNRYTFAASQAKTAGLSVIEAVICFYCGTGKGARRDFLQSSERTGR